MGHRAKYIVKSDRDFELYYSHWGANVVPSDFFWGPQAALEFVRSQKTTTEWLDDVWCEGGACLDTEVRRLVFFGGEDAQYDPFLRAVVLAFFEHTWAGWQVEWAHRGIFDLAREAGVDEAVVSARAEKSESRGGAPKPRPVRKNKPWSESVVEVDGKLYSLENTIDEVLRGGPKFLAALPKKPPAVCLDSCPPTGGAVFQRDQKVLRYWHTRLLEVPDRSLKGFWPGWLLVHRPEMAVPGALKFLKVAGQPAPSWAAYVSQLRSSVCRRIPSRALSLSGLQALHGIESDIELNPLATTDVRPQVDEETVKTIFDALARRVTALF